jgi:hypothetical protein
MHICVEVRTEFEQDVPLDLVQPYLGLLATFGLLLLNAHEEGLISFFCLQNTKRDFARKLIPDTFEGVIGGY